MSQIITPDEREIVIHFPYAGVDTSVAFSAQPNRPVYDKTYARTCVDAENVRAFDGMENRKRGGSRPGLARYIPALPDGTLVWIIQDLHAIAWTPE